MLLINFVVVFYFKGICVQDFPFFQAKECNNEAVSMNSNCNSRTDDEEDERFMFRTPLLQYIAHVKSASSHAASIILNQRMNQLQSTDFSLCKVALVPARPGRHDTQKDRWGACRLESILSKYGNTSESVSELEESALVMQCSSIGSMGKNEQFVDELAKSMMRVSNGNGSDTTGHFTRTKSTHTEISTQKHETDIPVEIVWPSVQCIARSYMGYQSGGSIPCNSATIEEYSSDSNSKGIRKGFADRFRKWDGGGVTTTSRAMFPAHMKCYFRYSRLRKVPTEPVRLWWFLLTSANLSQAAWGKRQRNGDTLYIKSYEMGVLFLPAWMDRQQKLYGVAPGTKEFSCTPTHMVLGVSRLVNSITPDVRVNQGNNFASKSHKRKFDDQTYSVDTAAGEIMVGKKCNTAVAYDNLEKNDEKMFSRCCIFTPVVHSNASSEPVSQLSHNVGTMSVTFSIPFSIPAQMYSYEGDDYPWTWDKLRPYPDRNGQIIMT
jgi:tyrosyl-DNA phosphodiesterase-1